MSKSAAAAAGREKRNGRNSVHIAAARPGAGRLREPTDPASYVDQLVNKI
jgi:hypothetical protein